MSVVNGFGIMSNGRINPIKVANNGLVLVAQDTRFKLYAAENAGKRGKKVMTLEGTLPYFMLREQGLNPAIRMYDKILKATTLEEVEAVVEAARLEFCAEVAAKGLPDPGHQYFVTHRKEVRGIDLPRENEEPIKFTNGVMSLRCSRQEFQIRDLRDVYNEPVWAPPVGKSRTAHASKLYDALINHKGKLEELDWDALKTIINGAGVGTHIFYLVD